jgi:hypothetical protein
MCAQDNTSSKEKLELSVLAFVTSALALSIEKDRLFVGTFLASGSQMCYASTNYGMGKVNVGSAIFP